MSTYEIDAYKPRGLPSDWDESDWILSNEEYQKILADVAERDRSIESLRVALTRISKTRIGLDPNDSDQEWREYWAEICHLYRQIARKALAGVDA